MAVFYKLYQDNRSTSNHRGEWYARAVHTGTVDIDDLAEEMQANCTVNIIQYFLLYIIANLINQRVNSFLIRLIVDIEHLTLFSLHIAYVEATE